ncbi:MAG: hypothetical protein ABI255_08440 [Microbacteriaceae bacterium]
MVISEWNELFVAAAGAAAALAGLIIVAMSVNVQTIIASRSLTSRAGATVAALVLILVVSVAGLIPAQPLAVIGAEVLVFSIAAMIPAVGSAWRIAKEREHSTRPQAIAKVILTIVPVVLFLVSGILLALSDPTGLYWVAAGTIVVFTSSVLNAWVMLVEILR